MLFKNTDPIVPDIKKQAKFLGIVAFICLGNKFSEFKLFKLLLYIKINKYRFYKYIGSKTDIVITMALEFLYYFNIDIYNASFSNYSFFFKLDNNQNLKYRYYMITNWIKNEHILESLDSLLTQINDLEIINLINKMKNAILSDYNADEIIDYIIKNQNLFDNIA